MNAFVAHLGRQMGAAHSIHLSWSQTSGSSHGQLERHFTQWKRTGTGLGGRTISSRYCLSLSTKCRGSDAVELNEGWKLFYSYVYVTMSSQAGVGIFVSPRLAHFVTDRIPLRGRVCLLKLRLQERLLCILQVYAPNTETQYQPFLDEIGVALQKITSAESIILLGDFNDMWVVLTTRHERVLTEDKETMTLTETEGFCNSSVVPPMECA